ncbi:H-2 class II histocompatibility antigen, A-U alpha chain-like [Mugil cephalus]|uniref:H-2 class II histocompatibility antigen, A-U alpha chain-like n=1 Tax=Mugil cephalus TaxID=48193 RepID=UPI001FB5C163|nr:H-2 class II histocompatibility antigen, A-U alpha chain-like [Mugil cephalus]
MSNSLHIKTCGSNMKLFIAVLMINHFCAFSQFNHEVKYLIGCFLNGTTEVQFEFDSEEILYVDFENSSVVYTVPRIISEDPSHMFENMHVFKNALKAKRFCPAVLGFYVVAEKNPPEVEDPPESILYPADEVEAGVENSLICFVNNFFPPVIKVSWTKNSLPVSEGVSLSRFYPNEDQTFYQFSTLTFTPREGDIYSCTVEHTALEKPLTRIWEPELSHRGHGLDVYCGVGLIVGFLGVAAGTFFLVKGLQRN